MINLQTTCERPRRSLEGDLALLLAQANGGEFPRKLFWEALSYDRVDEPLPLSVLPANFRGDIQEATILARAETIFVCYLHLRIPELSPSAEGSLDDRLAAHWQTALVLFSNLDQTEWDFCWRKGGSPRTILRLAVDAHDPAVRKPARRFARLSAVDPATGQPLSVLELAKNFDRVFATDSMQKRQRNRRRPSPLEPYLHDICKTALLNANEEKELARFIEDGDSDARNRFIRANLRMVVYVARNFIGKGLDIEDLIEEGNLGLLRAIDGFDSRRNYRFSTYAFYWIKQTIQRALCNTANTIRIPAYTVALLSEWRRTTTRLQNKLGRVPKHEEVEKNLGFSKKKLTVIRDALRANQANWPLDDTVDINSTTPQEATIRAEDLQRVVVVLDQMDKRQANVLRMRFGVDHSEPKTLKEIGEVLGLTRERVRQIENEALNNLAERMNAD